jgi:hypothetical protein
MPGVESGMNRGGAVGWSYYGAGWPADSKWEVFFDKKAGALSS